MSEGNIVLFTPFTVSDSSRYYSSYLQIKQFAYNTY